MKLIMLTWLIFALAYAFLEWRMWRNGGDDRPWYGVLGAVVLYATVLTVPTLVAWAVINVRWIPLCGR